MPNDPAYAADEELQRYLTRHSNLGALMCRLPVRHAQPDHTSALLELLAAACAEQDRYEFLLSVAPL